MSDPLSSALLHLPHGPEFRFLDRLVSLNPGQDGTGEYRVRGDEPFLRGHFPGDPIFPGVLLVEAAAQLAGAVVQSGLHFSQQRPLRLTAVRNAKILGSARPGDVIRMAARITGRMEHLTQAEVTASIGEKCILRGEVTLSEDSSSVV